MKIYTKKGDTGNTSLFGGQQVSKNSIRINSYGTVDELNSVLGMASSHKISSATKEMLDIVQAQLFVLGADLATPISANARISRISENEIEYLEKCIDSMEEQLPPLKNFILPGGSQAGAVLHSARTVCRRAERLTVDCSNEEEISSLTIKYLNRLSDFLFVLARFENYKAGVSETPWIPTR